MFIETGALPSNGRISPFSSLNTILPLIRSMEVRSTIEVRLLLASTPHTPRDTAPKSDSVFCTS